MNQNKLKDYQKQLFEYDYTLKKIDNILISTRLPQEEREQYKLSREACQKAKNKSSQEMADYARQNKLSLLIAPLSKDEKEELIQSMETGTGDSAETIRFDDVRGEDFNIEEQPSVPEVTVYKTKKLNEHVMNNNLEIEDVDNEDVGIDNIDNDNLEVENIDNGDNAFLEIEDLEKKDFDFGEEKDFSDYLENESDSLSFSPEVIDFVRSLKKELSLFYGREYVNKL
jgi:hypothetical protein